MGTNLVPRFAARPATLGLAGELGHCVHSVIDGLFDSYRPELHYMRGPGPKWRAKHGVRIGETVFVDGRWRGALAASARRTIKSQDRIAKWKGAAPMLQMLALVIAMLVNPATAARAETSYCGRTPDLAAARHRWAATRQSPVNPTLSDKNCRDYNTNFYEAVIARQAAALCEDGSDRQRDLEVLDSEIDAFNNLIATQCSG